MNNNKIDTIALSEVILQNRIRKTEQIDNWIKTIFQ